MRIAFVVNNYPPHAGGVEFHVRDLATELAEQGHDVTVFTLAEVAGDVQEGHIRVVRCKEHLRIGDVLAFPSPRTVRLIREVATSFDVVSVHTRFFPMTWVGVAVARAARVPVILTEHGSDHVASDSLVIRLAARLVDLTLGRWSLRRANVVLGVSPKVQAFARRISGVEARLFCNALSGFDPALRSKARRPWHVVFVGRVVRGKGWADFLDSVELLRDAGRPVTAELIGDGPDLDDARRAVASKGLTGIVTVRGRVEPSAVLEALAGSTLINPSVLAEGFQMTVLEAVAVGGAAASYPGVPSAEMLSGQGAPIEVVERTPAALADAVVRLADAAAWPVESVHTWLWPARAREYIDVMAGLHA